MYELYKTKENENVCLSVFVKCNWFFGQIVNPKVPEFLTAVLVETGAMPVPTKSRNPTICG